MIRYVNYRVTANAARRSEASCRCKMVLRRRRLCYVIVCICMLDVTSSRDATSLSVGEKRRSSRDNAVRWRYGGDQRQLASQRQGQPTSKTDQPLKTGPQIAAQLPCGPNSCLSSTDPEIAFFRNVATSSRGILNGSSQQPDNSLTSSRVITVKDVAKSSNKEQSSEDEERISSTVTSRLSFDQPIFHHSGSRLLSVPGTAADKVGPWYLHGV